MNWTILFSQIESHFGKHEKTDWMQAIKSIKKNVIKNPSNMDIYIRTIYIIHNILVEEYYELKDQNEMMTLLRAYFKKSYKLFSENAEYLFFIGKILHVAEWYFGLSDTSIALEMQKKAFEKEPYNLLYRWSYRLSVHNDLIADYYAYQLLTYEKDKIKWLIQKGFPGKYMLEQLQQSCQRFLGIENNSLRTTDLTTDTTL